MCGYCPSVRTHQAEVNSSRVNVFLKYRFYVLKEVRENGGRRGMGRLAGSQCYIWNINTTPLAPGSAS